MKNALCLLLLLGGCAALTDAADEIGNACSSDDACGCGLSCEPEGDAKSCQPTYCRNDFDCAAKSAPTGDSFSGGSISSGGGGAAFCDVSLKCMVITGSCVPCEGPLDPETWECKTCGSGKSCGSTCCSSAFAECLDLDSGPQCCESGHFCAKECCGSDHRRNACTAEGFCIPF